MCSARVRAMGLLILGILFLPACNALNPLCGSARPSPVMTGFNPTTVTFAQVQKTFPLTVTGSHFVSATVLVVNGTQVATSVLSSTQLIGTVGTAAIPASGSFKVYVSTPAGTSGDLGCSSGGNSGSLTLTVT